jgi:hypothetical protein
MGPQDASDRIWLKQAIQFSVDGQVHTIEIALPMRPGASAEEIERLLRQADAGLDQMTQHLNRKVEELRNQQRAQALEHGEAATGSLSSHSDARAGMPGQAPEGIGRLRPPTAAAPAGVGGPALDRKQFIAEIAMLGFGPRQAMERLGIHSLEGINLRQALEQLRLQVLRERSLPASGASAESEEAHSAPSSSTPRAAGGPQSGPLPRRPAPEAKHGPLLSQVAPQEHATPRPPLAGEVMLDDEEQALMDEAEQDQDEESDLPGPPRAPIPIHGERRLVSLQERVKAQALLDRLRRMRGRLNPPSSDNLKAFRNVVENQLGAQKTAALLQAVWDVSQPEKLSPDQVAECIRWGKDDHFEEEVDMLLSLTAAEEP